MPPIAALAPTPIALAAFAFVATNNYERIWSMKPSGRKCVGSWSIRSGWSKNTSGGFGREHAGSELSGVEGQIGRLRQGIVRLMDSSADGIIEKGECEPRIARMRERLKHMEQQAQNLKDQASLQRELRLILGRWQDFVCKIQEGLHAADWSARREIIGALVKRVEIDQEQVHIIFRINPSTPSSPSEKNSQSLHHCGGRDHAPLRASTQGFVIAPLLHISGLEQVPYESEKSVIVDLFSQDCQHDLMVEPVKTLSYVSLHQPFRARPCVLDFAECRVASALWPKPMGTRAELRLVICLKDLPDGLLK